MKAVSILRVPWPGRRPGRISSRDPLRLDRGVRHRARWWCAAGGARSRGRPASCRRPGAARPRHAGSGGLGPLDRVEGPGLVDAEPVRRTLGRDAVLLHAAHPCTPRRAGWVVHIFARRSFPTARVVGRLRRRVRFAPRAVSGSMVRGSHREAETYRSLAGRVLVALALAASGPDAARARATSTPASERTVRLCVTRALTIDPATARGANRTRLRNLPTTRAAGKDLLADLWTTQAARRGGCGGCAACSRTASRPSVRRTGCASTRAARRDRAGRGQRRDVPGWSCRREPARRWSAWRPRAAEQRTTIVLGPNTAIQSQWPGWDAYGVVSPAPARAGRDGLHGAEHQSPRSAGRRRGPRAASRTATRTAA